MQNESKSIFLGTVAILALLGLGLFGIYADTHQASTQSASVGGTGFALQCVDSTEFIATTLPGYDMACGGAATTTQDYLGAFTGQATTTLLTINIAHASSADVNLDTQAASTSGAVIQVSFWTSYNDLDWYPLSTSTAATGASTYNVINWALTGVASTTSIHLSNLNDQYLQVRAHAVTASSTLYAQIIPLQTITQ